MPCRYVMVIIVLQSLTICKFMHMHLCMYMMIITTWVSSIPREVEPGRGVRLVGAEPKVNGVVCTDNGAIVARKRRSAVASNQLRRRPPAVVDLWGRFEL